MANGHTLGFCVFAALSLAGTAAQAENLIVVEARGIGIKPGSSIDSTKPIMLKQGQHVTLISQSGATLTIDGPYNKPPAAGGQGRSIGATLAGLTTERTARTGEAGVTRGTTFNKLPAAWLVDVTHSGSACLQENREPVFWRPDSSSASSLTVMPSDHSWKSQAVWPAGTSTLKVTTDVPVHGGAAYMIKFNGSDYALAVSTIPASLSNDSMRAAWMLQKGCEAQAEALLRPRANE
jgi:hypothetical protein